MIVGNMDAFVLSDKLIALLLGSGILFCFVVFVVFIFINDDHQVIKENDRDKDIGQG